MYSIFGRIVASSCGMARPDGGQHPALEAAGDGQGREPEPVPPNDLDPVEAANHAEDQARRAVEGQGITARRRT